LNRKIADAQAALFAAQQEQSALVKTIDELEKEIARLKAWDGEKERYELKDVYHGGALVYALKPEKSGGEPPHWLCANCYQQQQKSIFQRANSTGFLYAYKCPRCRAEIQAPFEGPSASS